MTQEQMRMCMEMQAAGWTSVRLPLDGNSPVPGLILFADTGHNRLFMVKPDGWIVDLLQVYSAAEDTVRNWHEGMPKSIPQFVGDFGRLSKLADILNGRKEEPVDEPR